LYRVSIDNDPIGDKFKKSIQGLKNNRPDIAAEMLSFSRNQIKAALREEFGEMGDIMRRRGYGVASLGPKCQEVMRAFGRKLGKALFYQHIGRRLVGRIYCRSISLRDRDYMAALVEIAPSIPDISRSSKSLFDQFVYRFNFSIDYGILYTVVGFKEQLGYLIIAHDSRIYDSASNTSPEALANFEQLFASEDACECR